MLIVFFALTPLLTWHLIRNQAHVRTLLFKARYGTLYGPVDLYKGWRPLTFITVFLGRRFFVAMVVGLFADQPLLQLMLTFFLSSIVLLWHLLWWPMENQRQNILYLLNEYLYMTCCVCFLGFSLYNATPEVRFETGWVYTAFLGAILLTNVTVMIIEMCIGLIQKCRERIALKKFEKEREKRIHVALVALGHRKDETVD